MQMPEEVVKMPEEMRFTYNVLDELKERKRTMKDDIKTLKGCLKRNARDTKLIKKMMKSQEKISQESVEELRELLLLFGGGARLYKMEIAESKDAIREYNVVISDLKKDQKSLKSKQKKLKSLVKREKRFRERFVKLQSIKREEITLKQVDQRSDAHWQFERTQQRIEELEEEIHAINYRYRQVQNFYAYRRSGLTTSIHDLVYPVPPIDFSDEEDSEDEPEEEKRVEQQTTSDEEGSLKPDGGGVVRVFVQPCCVQ